MSQSSNSPPPRLARRRGRISHACVACQQKKQKCDGGTPACRNCMRANRTCISQDPATKRWHPRGYLESLEQHVAFLEGKFKEVQPEIDIDTLTSGNDPPPASLNERDNIEIVEITQDDESMAGWLPDPSLANSDTDGASSDGLSSLDMLYLQSAGAEPHYFGTSSAYSLTRLFSSTLRGVRAQGPGLTMSGVRNASIQRRPSPAPASLPDHTATKRLTGAYFDQVHTQFPFLHRPTFLQWEDGVFSCLKSGNAPNPVHLFFVYAVAAVGSLTESANGNGLHEGLYASSERLFEQVMQLNTLESIQAILCCAMYSLRSPVGVSVWTLSGLALRQCIELGLHRKIPWSRVESDILKTQMRRRVFWCSYNLDRAVAVTLGRPVGIADSDIDVEFPLDINDESIVVSGLLTEPRSSHTEPPTTISGAIHTIRVRHLWARIQSAMYPQRHSDGPEQQAVNSVLAESFKIELREWLDTAPDQFPTNKANNNAYGCPEWFELMYHHSILLLHRHRVVSPRQTGSDPTAPSVYEECASSAQSICQIYRQLYLSQRLNDTWGALHVLFLGGVTFLHCLWASPETRNLFRLDKVSATCTSCLMVLAVMTERWSAVEPYRDAFDMLSNATQTMMAEMTTLMTVPALPVFSSSTNDQISDHLASMAELGMCSSVEALLTDMIH